jgi:hypothetical protein
MSSADYLIAFGIPGLVATVALFWLALEQRRQWLAMKAIRQRVEIRLAFGVARQELFRLAANGDLRFEDPAFGALYRLDTQVMRDLDSHKGLAAAITRLIAEERAVPDERLAAYRDFATHPATAACARLQADAIIKLWEEHALEAAILRWLPLGALKRLAALARSASTAVSDLARRLDAPAGRLGGPRSELSWSDVHGSKPVVDRLVYTLNPQHGPIDGYGAVL